MSNQIDCIFCAEIAQSKSNIFYKSDDGLFIARWDHFPLTPGHLELMPARHVQYMADLSTAELTGMMACVREVVELVKATDFVQLCETLLDAPVNDMSTELLGAALTKSKIYQRPPDAYNFGINDGPFAGQSVPHLHLHIIPRWEGDVQNPRGGIRNMFAGDAYSQLSLK